MWVVLLCVTGLALLGLLGVAMFSDSRLLPVLIGLAIIAMAAAMFVFPLWFGLGLHCGSLAHPRFSDSAGAPASALAGRCRGSQGAWGGYAFTVFLAGTGCIMLGIYRAIGLHRTIIIVAALGIGLGSATVIPERGVRTALTVGAIAAACAIIGGITTRMLGPRRRAFIAAIWTVLLCCGIYLISHYLNWKEIVVMVLPTLLLAEAAYWIYRNIKGNEG